MTRSVLIVSPRFPPINAPDHQRVRLSLPYLREFGWDPHVLTVDPDYQDGFIDPTLAQTVPADVPITKTRAVPVRWTRRFGLGGLGYRALAHLRAGGNQLLTKQQFDLVYFSTTEFLTMALGPYWLRRHRVPYVLDFQDPWLTDYYETRGESPPGGKLKYWCAKFLAKRLEPNCVRQASHVIGVSPAYSDMFNNRYPDYRADKFTFLPFGGSERDIEVATRQLPVSLPFQPDDGLIHLVSLGAITPGFRHSLRPLFAALNGLRNEKANSVANKIRLHFIGTRYASGPTARKMVEPIADEFGLQSVVTETTNRIPYMHGLSALIRSHGVLIVGSDEPSYSPSRIFPCVLSRRPILSILHKDSPAADIIEKCTAGLTVRFGQDEPVGVVANRIKPLLLTLAGQKPELLPSTDWAAFQPYTAREMTRRQCEAFNSAVARHSAKSCR